MARIRKAVLKSRFKPIWEETLGYGSTKFLICKKRKILFDLNDKCNSA
jgi:hypothetical protein